MTVYAFLSGPGLVASLLVFGAGFSVRVGWYLRGLSWRRDRLAYHTCPVQAAQGAAWSLWRWLLPFGSRSARAHPVLTMASMVFHVCLLSLIMFQPGHAALRAAHGGGNWFALPLSVSDGLAVCAVAALVLLAVRRLCVPAVRFISTWRDWALLSLCFVMLVSGLLARLDSGGQSMNLLPHVSPWLLVHMAVSEVFLLLAPFTFLAHMVFFFLSRLHIGIDFAIKRGGRKRGAAFPW